MTRFSDAALLKGKYAYHADQLRAAAGKDPVDWEEAAADSVAEEAAQEVARHIFAFNEALDKDAEQMEIMTVTAAGQMKVLAIVPGESDLLRVDGVVMPQELPASIVVHASQLALTFVRVPIDKKAKEKDDGAQIGFVIFDDLKDRQKARYKKNKKTKKTAKKKAPTMAELRAKAKKVQSKKASSKKKATKKK